MRIPASYLQETRKHSEDWSHTIFYYALMLEVLAEGEPTLASAAWNDLQISTSGPRVLVLVLYTGTPYAVHTKRGRVTSAPGRRSNILSYSQKRQAAATQIQTSTTLPPTSCPTNQSHLRSPGSPPSQRRVLVNLAFPGAFNPPSLLHHYTCLRVKLFPIAGLLPHLLDLISSGRSQLLFPRTSHRPTILHRALVTPLHPPPLPPA